METPKIALVDADIVVYRSLWATVPEHQGSSMVYDAHTDTMIPSFTGKTTLNPFAYATEFIEALKRDTEVSKVLLCFSDPTANYRKTLFPAYKTGRRILTTEQRTTRDAIREHLMKTSEYAVYKRLEADDVIGILMSADTVCMSLDKDLDQIPGVHYNWNHQTFYEVSETEAWQWFLTQTIAGDRIDGYKGIPGIGIKKARKYLETHGWTWESVEDLYTSRGMFIEDALLNARLAKILRHNEYSDGKVKLWRGEWI